MPVVVNTELGSGLQRSRGVRKVEPAEVADAVVQALQHGRVDVFVPRSVAGLVRPAGIVPRKVADLVIRAVRADRVLVDPDPVRRADYERRTAAGEPLPAAAPAPTAAAADAEPASEVQPV